MGPEPVLGWGIPEHTRRPEIHGDLQTHLQETEKNAFSNTADVLPCRDNAVSQI